MSEVSINDHWYSRYKRLVEFALSRGSISGYTEKHHICPRSLFPELARDMDNLVVLTAREHFLAHWILAKMTNHNKMWYAFNMMKRLSKGRTSILYEYARIYISDAISEANTGKSHTQEFKDNVSKRMTGWVIAKDADGNKSRVNVKDSRYISGELIHHRIGERHNGATKQLMSANGIVGMVRYYNKNTLKSKFFKVDDVLSDDWVKGYTDEELQANSDGVSGLSWITNTTTNENVRICDIENIPEGWRLGRYFTDNLGLNAANSMTSVVDLINKVCTKVHNVEWYHAPDSGRSTKDTLIYTYDDIIFTSAKKLDEYLITVGVFIECDMMTTLKKFNTYTVPKPHHNNSISKRMFRADYKGCTFNQLSIQCLALDTLNENLKEYTIYGK